MSDTTRSRETTRMRLIEAGIREFGRRGVDATTVEHLCEAAGFTRGAFYSNFATKDELCLAIIDHTESMHAKRIVQAVLELPEDLSPADSIDYIQSALQIDDDLRLFGLEIRLRALRNPEFAKLVNASNNASVTLFAKLIKLAADRARVELLVAPEELLQILEGILMQPQLGMAGEFSSEHLMNAITQNLIRPKE